MPQGIFGSAITSLSILRHIPASLPMSLNISGAHSPLPEQQMSHPGSRTQRSIVTLYPQCSACPKSSGVHSLTRPQDRKQDLRQDGPECPEFWVCLHVRMHVLSLRRMAPAGRTRSHPSSVIFPGEEEKRGLHPAAKQLGELPVPTPKPGPGARCRQGRGLAAPQGCSNTISLCFKAYIPK